jgi:glycosyltransferase involved in cell wall biosynthesis
MKSLVSVIIPCYNAEQWLGDAIRSCLDQTYHPIEVIVVDDGSTDKSKKVVLDVARNAAISIRLIESTHYGASTARNKGLAAAHGDYVQFLDADDLMSRRKIELQSIVATQDNEVVPHGPWLWFRQSRGSWVTEHPRQLASCAGNSVQEWLEGTYSVVHCFLWPRKTVVELGGWDESLSIWQDADLFLRAVFKGVRFCFVPESAVYYRKGHTSDSVSSSRSRESMKSRIRVLNKIQAGLESRLDLQRHRALLARTHYLLARTSALDHPEEARECFARFLQLSPDGRVPGSMANHLATRLLGVVWKERMARAIRAIKQARPKTEH